jgi:hypothetical protein
MVDVVGATGRMFFHNAIDSNGVIGDRSSFTGQQQQGPVRTPSVV